MESVKRICCVARDGSRCPGGYPIWTGGVYEAQPRADGVVTWRRVGSYGGTRATRRASRRFCDYLRDVAPHEWSEARVRHGDAVVVNKEVQ
jgi:hypothetical protein